MRSLVEMSLLYGDELIFSQHAPLAFQGELHNARLRDIVRL